MNLTKEEITGLEEKARSFGTESHERFLADALRQLRRTGNIIEPLQMLRVLWDSPFARRAHIKAALNDVGIWLENLLTRNPSMDEAKLAAYLAWLRRLCRIHLKEEQPQPPTEIRRRFGDLIPQLRARRSQQSTPPRRA
ncbi:MAG: hypothetical protein U1A78_33135 [Polyangia bacterium]